MIKLTTKRLLAYRDSLYRFPETADWDAFEKTRGFLSKASPEWIETMESLKAILSGREHIEKKHETKIKKA